MPIMDGILMELDQESQTTKRVLDRVPEDKLGWRPHPRSQSLGELAMHVANIQGYLAGAASQDTFEFAGGGPPEPKTRKEILDAFAKGTASAKEILSKMDDARLMSIWNGTVKGKTVVSVPRIGLIRGILMNHVYHHRGQLTVYLRLLDVPVPSIYGPSADENPFA